MSSYLSNPGNLVLILGSSGSGKTASLRNLDPRKCLLIQTVAKTLPFRKPVWELVHSDGQGGYAGSVAISDDSSKIIEYIRNAPSIGKDVVIIDDFQYIMVNQFMRKASEKGFEKFTQIGTNIWNLINEARAVAARNPKLRIYFLSHIQTDEFGFQKIKTIGKMLDEKVDLEGYFTTVIKCVTEGGKHAFITKTKGNDTVKTPIGMFENEFVDNDLALVDKAYTDYFNIGE